MSRRNLEKSLKRELRALNEIIDQKIIRGLPYNREAKRHKFILSSLADIRRTEGRNIWFKTFSLV